MIIRCWLPWIVFSYFAIECILAKTISLNDLIAAEERQKQTTVKTFKPKSSSGQVPKSVSLNDLVSSEDRHKPTTIKTLKPTLFSETSERFSLNNVLRSKPTKSKFKTTDKLFARSKLSPLKYKKEFEIRSPLKPKRLNYIQKARLKRKNQSIKREIAKDEVFSRKYIPLLKSLSLLFDNIMDDEINNSDEFKRTKFKRRKSSKASKPTCTCNDKLKSSTEEPKPPTETIISTTLVNEVTTSTESAQTETPTATTDNITTSDVGSVGPNTDLPTVLTRNTTSTRGDDTGLSQRGNASFYPSFEGNITRHHRNSEHNTGRGENTTSTENNEENPFSPSRNHASGDGHGGRVTGVGDDTRVPVYRRGADETYLHTKNENVYDQTYEDYDTYGDIRKNFNESKKENYFQVRRDETESAESISHIIRRNREPVSEDNDGYKPEPLQSEKNHEESDYDVTHNISSDQRIFIGSSASSTEDKSIGTTNATVISLKDLNNPIIMLQNSPKYKAPYVTIFDGYSVARDKNGSNKLTEKSIRIHS